MLVQLNTLIVTECLAFEMCRMHKLRAIRVWVSASWKDILVEWDAVDNYSTQTNQLLKAMLRIWAFQLNSVDKLLVMQPMLSLIAGAVLLTLLMHAFLRLGKYAFVKCGFHLNYA